MKTIRNELLFWIITRNEYFNHIKINYKLSYYYIN